MASTVTDTFTGKVALVTGGGTGIGRATALAFAAAGAQVVVAGRREAEGAETVRQIREAGGDATFVQADVADAESVRHLIEATVQTYGRLDVAFNNAGIIGTLGPVASASDDEYDAVMNTNVRGVWLAMKYEIPAMLANGGGAIVNTSSAVGNVGAPGLALYVASKFAVEGLTKSTALELARSGIRVNAISPGAVETPMIETGFGSIEQGRAAMGPGHPVGRLGVPDEIAGAVLFLASPAASFITGASLLVDGGYTAQ